MSDHTNLTPYVITEADIAEADTRLDDETHYAHRELVARSLFHRSPADLVAQYGRQVLDTYMNQFGNHYPLVGDRALADALFFLEELDLWICDIYTNGRPPALRLEIDEELDFGMAKARGVKEHIKALIRDAIPIALEGAPPHGPRRTIPIDWHADVDKRHPSYQAMAAFFAALPGYQHCVTGNRNYATCLRDRVLHYWRADAHCSVEPEINRLVIINPRMFSKLLLRLEGENY